MKKIFIIFFYVLLSSCTNKNKNEVIENTSKKVLLKKSTNKPKESEIDSISIFTDSIKRYRLEPVDTLKIANEIKPQLEKVKISNNEIEIFRENGLNITWIKINSKKILVDNLRTINSSTGGDNNEMFGNDLIKIKYYNYKKNKIIMMIFHFSPCTGLGCSVTDYLIYNLNTKQINLFENFRGSDEELYDFGLNSEINYISTEYNGDYHGATSIHFKSKLYSMKKDGKFETLKDKNKNEYYFESITYPNDTLKHMTFKKNWFRLLK